jgi:mycofactocin radical SAM maturase
VTLPLVEQFAYGLDAPICLTWEMTYACNLSCVHCLSSSGRRDARELTTAECMAVIDELEQMQVFYVNIGGGEPTVRADFWDLVDYATAHHVGVKFSTNGVKITPEIARRLAAGDYVDVQISLDGATAEVNDAVRGQGSYATALRAMRHLAAAGFRGFTVSVMVTRQNVGQLDAFAAIAEEFCSQLRLTRLRPSGRGADVWDELHPTAGQQRQLYDWLVARGEQVLTGDSFFHLAAYGDSLPGLNLCGAGRVVCLIDPVGDVYACPFAIHDSFLAGNVRGPGGFAAVWRESELFASLRRPRPGAPAARVRPTTRAVAGAWRPSSSPGCRWTAPTRSASRGMASTRSRRSPAPPCPGRSGDLKSARSGDSGSLVRADWDGDSRGQAAGPLVRVRVVACDRPLWSIHVIEILSPGWYRTSVWVMLLAVEIDRPPTAVIVSPAVRPARAIGDLGTVPAMVTPDVLPRLDAPNPPIPLPEALDGAISRPRKAVAPMWISEVVVPDSICLAMDST